jgi:hypothetical protein
MTNGMYPEVSVDFVRSQKGVFLLCMSMNWSIDGRSRTFLKFTYSIHYS